MQPNQSATCSVCGQVLGVQDGSDASGSTVSARAGESNVTVICKSCSSKLVSSHTPPENMRFDRTTVMRPVVSANLTGKEVPHLIDTEPSTLR